MKKIIISIMITFICSAVVIAADEHNDFIDNMISATETLFAEIDIDRTSANRITISYDTMVYHIHVPDKLGRMQPWHEKVGPNKEGLKIEIYINDAPYTGPMDLPQKLSRAYSPYWDTYINEVKIGSRYYLVYVMFGEKIDINQRNKILKLINLNA